MSALAPGPAHRIKDQDAFFSNVEEAMNEYIEAEYVGVGAPA